MNIAQKKGRQLRRLCDLLGYSRQAFYQQQKTTERSILASELIIQEVLYIRSRQRRVGARKLQLMLLPFMLGHQINIGRDALFDLLSANNLLVRRRRRRSPRTTFSDHGWRKYPDLTIEMPVLQPNRLWVSDITYITLKDGFAYLSLITDAYSRMITGYYLGIDLRAEGCVKALKRALKQLPRGHQLIHHSDRGCQYCSTEYVEQLQGRHIAISMTQNSDPRENAIAERVNGILKQEFFAVSYGSFKQANEDVKQAINIYNHERLHSSIGMLTPAQAHTMTGKLKQYWKGYTKKEKQEVVMI